MPFSLSAVPEVGLGLALIYYLLSLIVSYVTSTVSDTLGLRARDLEVGLRELLQDSGKFEEFLKHPWVESLKVRRLRFLKGGYQLKPVEHIPVSTFVLTLLDILVPGGHGKAESDFVREIREAIDGLPEGRTKRSLKSAFNVGATNLESARTSVENWFNDTMESISGLHKQHARRIAVLVALVLTLVLGADSVSIANSLWREPSVRAAIAAETDRLLADAPDADIQTLLAELEELRIPILWAPDELPQDPAGWAWKVTGLSLTWLAASQGSSFWYQILRKLRSA